MQVRFDWGSEILNHKAENVGFIVITGVAGQKAVIIELRNLIGLERSILTSPRLLFSGKAR